MTNTNETQTRLEIGIIGDFALDDWDNGRFQKFIVERTSDSLIWHAHPALYNTPYHRDIARIVRAKEVIGGGRIRIDSDDITKMIIYDTSEMYGPVNREILERFTPILLPAYQKIASEIMEIKIEG